MSEVTRILSAIGEGDPGAAGELLSLVYGELRKLAAVRLAHEKAGQALDATALIHEAYLQVVRGGAILDCLARAKEPWARAALGKGAPHAPAFRTED
jgi:ECF sigma factor